jgi:hypothetical protein
MKASDVIQHFGSIAEAARALGVTRGAVWQWKNKGDRVPRGAAYIVQAVTDGALAVDPSQYPPKQYDRRRLTA